MNVTAHQEKKKDGEPKTGKRKAGEGRRQAIDLKNLCAALLRSFMGQQGEEMEGSSRGSWDPREGQQPYRPNPNGVGNRTTTSRRVLIGAVLLEFESRVIDVESRVESSHLFQTTGVKSSLFLRRLVSLQHFTTLV